MEESLPSLFRNELWLWNKYFSGRIAFGLDDVNTAAIQMDGPVISAQTSDEVSIMENVINGVQQEMEDQLQESFSEVSQEMENATFICGTTMISDYDGNKYATVKIGNQCWMQENLRTTHYSDGEFIPTQDTTGTLDHPEANRYAPDNYAPNVPEYGYLYSRLATMRGTASSNTNPSGIQGICPTGWHVPSNLEWQQLFSYVGSMPQYQCDGSSTNIAKALASSTTWTGSANSCAIGNTPSQNNTTGFSALAAGSYNFNKDLFACFWSATEDGGISEGNYCSLYFDYTYPELGHNTPEDEAFSVRCVRDEVSPIDNALEGLQGMINNGIAQQVNQLQQIIDSLQNEIVLASCGFIKVTDVDGNEYQTVRISNQCWMKENLRTTKYADGTEISYLPLVSDLDEQAYYTYPVNNPSNAPTYGLLYNWKAAMNGATSVNVTPSGVQGICPDCWHLPSENEWEALRTYVGSRGIYLCGGNSVNIAKALASTTGWDSSVDDCVPGNTPTNNNATDFNALPASIYNSGTGEHPLLGNFTGYWSTTEQSTITARFLSIDNGYTDAAIASFKKSRGLSVRCLKD